MRSRRLCVVVLTWMAVVNSVEAGVFVRTSHHGYVDIEEARRESGADTWVVFRATNGSEQSRILKIELEPSSNPMNLSLSPISNTELDQWDQQFDSYPMVSGDWSAGEQAWVWSSAGYFGPWSFNEQFGPWQSKYILVKFHCPTTFYPGSGSVLQLTASFCEDGGTNEVVESASSQASVSFVSDVPILAGPTFPIIMGVSLILYTLHHVRRVRQKA